MFGLIYYDINIMLGSIHSFFNISPSDLLSLHNALRHSKLLSTICHRYILTHWGRVTHICVSKLTIIGSDDGLAPTRRQAVIWTNARILLIRPLGTNFNEMFIEIQTSSFMKMHLKVSSAKLRPFRLSLNVLIYLSSDTKPWQIWLHDNSQFSLDNSMIQHKAW